MKTLGKAFLGAAMLIGTAIAAAAPAAAQPYGYGGSYGYSGPSYNERGAYGDQFTRADRGTYGIQRRGTWRWNPYLHRRVWVPYRYSRFDRDRHDRDYGWDRYEDRGDWRR
jgi:hypothetical protein